MKIKIIGKYAIRDAKGVFRYPGEELEAPGDLALHDAERHVAGGRAELILKEVLPPDEKEKESNWFA